MQKINLRKFCFPLILEFPSKVFVMKKKIFSTLEYGYLQKIGWYSDIFDYIIMYILKIKFPILVIFLSIVKIISH